MSMLEKATPVTEPSVDSLRRQRRVRSATTFCLLRMDLWRDRLDDFLITRLLRRAGARHAPTISTHTTRRELNALFRLAVCAQAGSRALEIGSYVGASTCYLAAGLAKNGGHLYCVDTWHNETMPEGVLDTYALFQKHTDVFRQSISMIRGRSNEIGLGALPSNLSLIFIDGDHSYEVVRTDFERFSPLLSPGGIIAFHDCLWFEGVSRTIGEAMASGKWKIAGHADNLLWLKPASW